MKVYYVQKLEITQHTSGHTARSQVQSLAKGPAFIGVTGVRGRAWWSHSLLENLKHKSGNLKLWKRENKLPKWSVQKSTKISKKRNFSLGRWLGSLPSPVTDKVFIPDSFPWRNASLNWVPLQSKLITKEEKFENLLGFHMRPQQSAGAPFNMRLPSTHWHGGLIWLHLQGSAMCTLLSVFICGSEGFSWILVKPPLLSNTSRDIPVVRQNWVIISLKRRRLHHGKLYKVYRSKRT